MAYGMKQWDENGRELATIPYETLIALPPLTDDPDSALKKLGIESPELKAALIKVAEVVKSENQ